MSRRRGTPNPPMLNANIEAFHKYRFLSSAAFTGIITDQLLLNAIGAVNTTTVLSFALAQSVKLEAVEMWAPVSAQGASVTLSLEWPTSGQNMAREVTDTSNSVSHVAHVKSKPPQNSLSGFWSTYSGTPTNLFILNVPTATVIDVSVSFVLNDGVNSTPTNGVTVGGSIGAVTYGYLDSLTAAGAKLAPVALTAAP